MKREFSEFRPYVNLANAIVKSVARDYKKTLKRLLLDPEDLGALYLKGEAERFFLSDWYQVLTDINPKYLIRKIQQEVGYCDQNN